MEKFECIKCKKTWEDDAGTHVECPSCHCLYVWWNSHPLVQNMTNEEKEKHREGLLENKQI